MVHDRVNELNSLARKIDRQLESQLSRKSELEQMKAAADGLAGLVVDVQQKMAAVSATQGQLTAAHPAGGRSREQHRQGGRRRLSGADRRRRGGRAGKALSP